MAKKIVLIGAGSAMFTRGLVADLIQARDLAPWTVGLVDSWAKLQARERGEGGRRDRRQARAERPREETE